MYPSKYDFPAGYYALEQHSKLLVPEGQYASGEWSRTPSRLWFVAQYLSVSILSEPGPGVFSLKLIMNRCVPSLCLCFGFLLLVFLCVLGAIFTTLGTL